MLGKCLMCASLAFGSGEISAQDAKQILADHFYGVYDLLPEYHFIPEASSETTSGLYRCLSGIPHLFLNTVAGIPTDKATWDRTIQEQIAYFQKANIPFVWFVDEDTDSSFQKKLLEVGFQDLGVFRGVIGKLDTIPEPEIPANCTLEQVTTDESLEAFSTLVADVFEMHHAKREYDQVLREGMHHKEITMNHWLARMDGKPVAGVSTYIQGDVVSFWNGATLPETRRMGLSTALRRFALKDAMAKGCKVGMSYLMAEGLAFGICSKFGYETKWKFRVFAPPVNPS